MNSSTRSLPSERSRRNQHDEVSRSRSTSSLDCKVKRPIAARHELAKAEHMEKLRLLVEDDNFWKMFQSEMQLAGVVTSVAVIQYANKFVAERMGDVLLEEPGCPESSSRARKQNISLMIAKRLAESSWSSLKKKGRRNCTEKRASEVDRVLPQQETQSQPSGTDEKQEAPTPMSNCTSTKGNSVEGPVVRKDRVHVNFEVNNQLPRRNKLGRMTLQSCRSLFPQSKEPNGDSDHHPYVDPGTVSKVGNIPMWKSTTHLHQVPSIMPTVPFAEVG